jgi:hypothetical protein
MQLRSARNDTQTCVSARFRCVLGRLRIGGGRSRPGQYFWAESKRWEKEALACPVPQPLKNSAAERLATLTAQLEQSPLRFLAV